MAAFVHSNTPAVRRHVTIFFKRVLRDFAYGMRAYVRILTCIQELLGSSFGRETGHLKVFHEFPQYLQADARIDKYGVMGCKAV
jgi:hypothetical protein